MKQFIRHIKSTYSGIPGMVWQLSAVVFVNRLGMVVLFYLTLYLTRKLGFSVSEAGTLVSIYGVGSLAGSYLGGWLSDRWGAFRVQLASLLLSGIGYLWLLKMATFWELAVSLLLIAVFAESLRPANMTATAEACPPEIRARGFALNRLAINAGVAVGPAVGGQLARLDYNYLFWMDGLTCLAAASLFTLFFHTQLKQSFKTPAAVHDAVAHPLRDRAFVSLLALLLILGMFFFQLVNTWPLYLKDHYALLENRIGLLLAANAVFLVLFEMPIIHRLEKKQPLRIVSIGVLFLFAGFAVLPLGSSFSFALFSTLVWTVGEMLIFPASSTWIANRAPDRVRGKYMGFYTFSFSISFVFGPTFGALIYDKLGANVLWYGMGIVGLFQWIGFRGLARFVNKPANRQSPAV